MRKRHAVVKNNGTSFTQPYVPDEYKRIVGPIEYEFENSGTMTRAILIAALVVSAAGGMGLFVYAMATKVF
jgi:hypothetical protein